MDNDMFEEVANLWGEPLGAIPKVDHQEFYNCRTDGEVLQRLDIIIRLLLERLVVSP